MLSRFRNEPQRFVLVVCSVLLAMLLAACGGAGTSSSPTPTPTQPPSPTPSPTPTSSSGLTTYSGDGYTIGYPVGWKVNAQATKVTFTDATGIYNLTIVVTPDPGGTVGTSTFVDAGITGLKTTLQNPQTVNVPPTTTVGGDNWAQKSESGTSTSNGQSVTTQFVVLSDNHPASSSSTKNYTVIYGTAQQLFSTANSTYFQPMLQSFKFTS